VEGRANERYALLFRDYLRANDGARQAWAEFKRRLASHFATDLATYGQLKDPATDLLIVAAEQWAAQNRLGISPMANLSLES
jgi:dephospho-CoA kinase